MAFEKGKPRPKNAGRKKGTPNHRTLLNKAIEGLKDGQGKKIDFWDTVLKIAIKNANEHHDSTLLKQLCNSLVPPQTVVKAGEGEDSRPPSEITVKFG